MTTAVPEVVTRYFEADARRDIDALVALFTDDAVVIDEGKTRRGPPRSGAGGRGRRRSSSTRRRSSALPLPMTRTAT